MKRLVALITAIVGSTLASDCASAQAAKSGVERLYIIDCGTSVGRVGAGVSRGAVLMRSCSASNFAFSGIVSSSASGTWFSTEPLGGYSSVLWP